MAMSKQGKSNMDVLNYIGEMLYDQGPLDALILFRKFLDTQEEENHVAWTVDLIKDTLDSLIEEKSEKPSEEQTLKEEVVDEPVTVTNEDGSSVTSSQEGVTINFGENGIPLGSTAVEDIASAFGSLLGGLTDTFDENGIKEITETIGKTIEESTVPNEETNKEEKIIDKGYQE